MRFGHGQAAAALALVLTAFSGSAAALSLDLDPQLGDIEPNDTMVDEVTPPALDLGFADELRDQAIGSQALDSALTMLGTSYKYGSRAKDGVDCSGLVQRAYRVAGVDLPRSTKEQIHLGVPVAAGKLRKGDLLFYRWTPRTVHVAMYMDDTHILHASPKEGRVVVTRLTPNWDHRLIAARRMI